MNQLTYPNTFEIYRMERSKLPSRQPPPASWLNVSMSPGQWQQPAAIANELGVDLVEIAFPKTTPYSQLVAPGYAGFRIFDTARQTYRNTNDIKETVLETGDATLFHLLATVAIPLFISNKARKYIKSALQRLKSPTWFAKHANPLSILLSGGLLVLLTKPVNTFIGFLLDRYYRPWARLKPLHDIEAQNAQKRVMTVS